MTLTQSSARYTIISADCHAGGSMAQYRDYLEERHLPEFDEWRGNYRNPFRDLQDDGRSRNWDDERRNRDLETDGQVAEIVFPNTVPPFFPTGAVIARPPMTARDLELRWAGLRAHNRWLADWCARFPDRRAGIGQIFLNDVNLAVDEVRWIAAHGLRGGVLIPGVPDDVDIAPLYDEVYDPLWRTCEELGVVLNHHSGTGGPDYGRRPSSMMQRIIETQWFANRSLWHLLMSGVFERFPTLKCVFTEQGSRWVPPLLAQLDMFHMQMSMGRVGEMDLRENVQLSMRPSEYFQRNIWIGVSFAGISDARAMERLGLDRVMWGSDYPHQEGSTPHSAESLRRAFSGWDPEAVRQVLSRTQADVYGFDLAALAPLAATVGPTVAEIQTPLDVIPADSTCPGFYL